MLIIVQIHRWEKCHIQKKEQAGWWQKKLLFNKSWGFVERQSSFSKMQEYKDNEVERGERRKGKENHIPSPGMIFFML